MGAGSDLASNMSLDGVKGVWPRICKDLTEIILKGVTECAVERTQRSKMILGIYSTIVGDVNASDVEGNLLWKTSDEMVQNYINDTAFMTSIRKAITDGLCDLDITQVFGKNF